MKLTWDDDDPERNQITRRALTKKEIEENDFRAYIASSESEDEGDASSKAASRDKLRALLLGGNDDALPEGWGKGDDDGDADMEITFTPGLSETKNKDDETTLEAYKRKMKEKKKKRKEERAERVAEKEDALAGDDFFAAGSGDEDGGEEEEEEEPRPSNGKGKAKKGRKASPEPVERHVSTAEELALIAASENPDKDPKHFDMKAIIKSEKLKGKKKKGKKGKTAEQAENETQDDFEINVKDDRFKALHEDHTFAIDPSNPQ